MYENAVDSARLHVSDTVSNVKKLLQWEGFRGLERIKLRLKHLREKLKKPEVKLRQELLLRQKFLLSLENTKAVFVLNLIKAYLSALKKSGCH